MKKWMIILSIGLMTLAGCVREEVPYYPTTNAFVEFDFWSDRYNTEIEGDLYNDGETYIEAVQLEVRTYDKRGYIIAYEYFWVDTYFRPGERISFVLQSPVTYAANVEIYIYKIE